MNVIQYLQMINIYAKKLELTGGIEKNFLDLFNTITIILKQKYNEKTFNFIECD